jgi:hypothetical protein
MERGPAQCRPFSFIGMPQEPAHRCAAGFLLLVDIAVSITAFLFCTKKHHMAASRMNTG